MFKYYINWFRYVGLFALYLILQTYFGVQFEYLVRFLICVSLILISVEKNPEYYDDNIY